MDREDKIEDYNGISYYRKMRRTSGTSTLLSDIDNGFSGSKNFEKSLGAWHISSIFRKHFLARLSHVGILKWLQFVNLISSTSFLVFL